MSHSANIVALKKMVRKMVREKLKAMAVERVVALSDAVSNSFTKQRAYQEAKVVSIFLSMPPPLEIQTWTLLKQCFLDGKRVYVPTVTGKGPNDMVMVPAESYEEILSWPLSKWKIKEPTQEYIDRVEDGTESGVIDLVIVPGLAFSASSMRLGQGRGYYDTFFQKLNRARSERNLPKAMYIGIGFDEQIVDEIPVEDHDQPLDGVLTPSFSFPPRIPTASTSS